MLSSKQRYNHTTEVHNLKDPEIIVPLLIRMFNPSSVIDVGCGLGNFLKIFCDYGIKDVIGIDGEWVDQSKMYISGDQFLTRDLEKAFDLGRRFDLVICLEVAEHLSPDVADMFIRNLVQLSDYIIFSAAVPGQGGDSHLNEQDVRYWQEKFGRSGYVFYDLFRNTLWDDQRLKWWYRQNMFLVVKNDIVLNETISGMLAHNSVLTLIHPELFQHYYGRYIQARTRLRNMEDGNFSLYYYFNLFLKATRKKLSTLLGGIFK